MKTILSITLSVALTIPTVCSAMQFSWGYDVRDEADIDGYRIFMDSSATAPFIDNISKSLRTVEAPTPTDNKCHNFWIVAFKGSQVSPNSNVAVWCPANVDPPPAQQIPGVSGFKITTVTTVTPTE